MVNEKVGFFGNLQELSKVLGTEEPEPIIDATEGTEVSTINAILQVLRARGFVAEAE